MPIELLVKDEMFSINFHKSSFQSNRVSWTVRGISYFADLFKDSLIYISYIEENSDMGYIEYLLAMDNTGGDEWINCNNNGCKPITRN